MHIEGEIMNVKWVNFSGKLWNLVEDPSTNHFICWNWVRHPFGITPNGWASFELFFSFYISKWLLFFKEVAKLFYISSCWPHIFKMETWFTSFVICRSTTLIAIYDSSNVVSAVSIIQIVKRSDWKKHIFSIISFIQRYIHLLNGSISGSDYFHQLQTTRWKVTLTISSLWNKQYDWLWFHRNIRYKALSMHFIHLPWVETYWSCCTLKLKSSA